MGGVDIRSVMPSLVPTSVSEPEAPTVQHIWHLFATDRFDIFSVYNEHVSRAERNGGRRQREGGEAGCGQEARRL